jgi:hypothetical protein
MTFIKSTLILGTFFSLSSFAENEKDQGGEFLRAQIIREIQAEEQDVMKSLSFVRLLLPSEMQLKFIEITEYLTDPSKKKIEVTRDKLEALDENGILRPADAITDRLAKAITYSTGSWQALNKCNRQKLIIHEINHLSEIEKTFETRTTEAAAFYLSACRTNYSSLEYLFHGLQDSKFQLLSFWNPNEESAPKEYFKRFFGSVASIDYAFCKSKYAKALLEDTYVICASPGQSVEFAASKHKQWGDLLVPSIYVNGENYADDPEKIKGRGRINSRWSHTIQSDDEGSIFLASLEIYPEVEDSQIEIIVDGKHVLNRVYFEGQGQTWKSAVKKFIVVYRSSDSSGR